MYQRILLAYDGTREGLVALREGALLAKRFGAQIFLLSVLPPMSGIELAEEVSADVVEQQLDTYRSVLQRGVDVARRLGLEPTAKLAVGEPAHEIGSFAKEIKADLVVLGHRRQNLLERWWSGASGAYVSDHVKCSVLIARNGVTDDAFRAELSKPEAAAAPESPAT
jgi:nucleotide-binding universal stress UspA family protein